MGFLFIVLIFAGTGYVKNIIKLTQCDFEAPYKAEVIHTAGLLVPPVEMIVGWFNLNIGK
jgi:hypothetical protein